MKFCSLVSLAVCLLASAAVSQGALVTVPLKDAFGVDSGWDAILSDDIHTGIVVDKVTSTYVRIEIFKDLYLPAENGQFPPHVIQFHARVGAAPAVSTIRITDETIINDTGSPWLDYHWAVSGAAASFNKTLTDASGFSVTPFQAKAWGPTSYDTDHSNSLGAFSGLIPVGGSYRPGLDAGELYIDVLSNVDSRDFTLMQYPTPEPATLATLVLGGAGVLARRRRHGAV
ncbi:MAG: PEP-CTERM sorting domain-containing protein [Planctomycetota bacterium]|nr:PEP-CTERM sorting domain-containing protein [Planctomycetota bacterium]